PWPSSNDTLSSATIPPKLMLTSRTARSGSGAASGGGCFVSTAIAADECISKPIQFGFDVSNSVERALASFLRRHLHIQLGHACDVAARPAEAGDQANLNRIRGRFEAHRNGRSRGLCRKRRRSTGRRNHGDPTTN